MIYEYKLGYILCKPQIKPLLIIHQSEVDWTLYRISQTLNKPYLGSRMILFSRETKPLENFRPGVER